MSARILVIEDDPSSLELMTYLLTAHGHTALAASRGDTGLSMARETRPDLVISDILGPAASETRRRQVRSRRGTLLVVDDSATNAELKRSIFEPSGYHVVTADTVAAGLALAHSVRPLLIISDTGLPDGSGLDLIQAVKADHVLCSTPIVIITATHVDPQTRDAALALGASRFLVRPLDAPRVLQEIESCLAPGEVHGNHSGR